MCAMTETTRDTLFAQARDQLVDFAFDEQVACVFPDMIRRSVPGYETFITLIGLLAERYAQPNSVCYDLGCSLGAATLAMRRRVAAQGVRIIGVDSSDAMAERCRHHLAADTSPVPAEIVCADIRAVAIENASVVVLGFTLQFIPPDERLPLLRRILSGLRPGGVLLLLEKVVFDPPDEQCFQEEMHLAFKRANGYSELEISQKRNALERVLVPETIEAHRRRLTEAGFSSVHEWMRCFNFAALAAFA